MEVQFLLALFFFFFLELSVMVFLVVARLSFFRGVQGLDRNFIHVPAGLNPYLIGSILVQSLRFWALLP
jgi:hypothetical protein